MAINKQLKTLVLSMLNDGDSLQAAAIALSKVAAGMPYAAFNDACAQVIAEKYGVEPYESRKGGTLTFTKDSAEEFRLKQFRRMHPDMANKAHKTQPTVVIRERVVSAAVRATVSVISGMSKHEFNEFMRQMRDAVEFV